MRLTLFLALITLSVLNYPTFATSTWSDELLEESEYKQSTEPPSRTLLVETVIATESPTEHALRILEDMKRVSALFHEKKLKRGDLARKGSSDSEFEEMIPENGVKRVKLQSSANNVQAETNKLMVSKIVERAVQTFLETSPYCLPTMVITLQQTLDQYALMINQLKSASPLIPEHNFPPFDHGVENIEKRQALLLGMQTKVFDLYTVNEPYLALGKAIPENIYKQSEGLVQELNELANKLGEI